MPRGRPHASWLRQVESYLKDTGMAGLASAWAMARWRPREYRRNVDAATRCFGVCYHTRPGLTCVYAPFRPRQRHGTKSLRHGLRKAAKSPAQEAIGFHAQEVHSKLYSSAWYPY